MICKNVLSEGLASGIQIQDPVMRHPQATWMMGDGSTTTSSVSFHFPESRPRRRMEIESFLLHYCYYTNTRKVSKTRVCTFSFAVARLHSHMSTRIGILVVRPASMRPSTMNTTTSSSNSWLYYILSLLLQLLLLQDGWPSSLALSVDRLPFIPHNQGIGRLCDGSSKTRDRVPWALFQTQQQPDHCQQYPPVPKCVQRDERYEENGPPRGSEDNSEQWRLWKQTNATATVSISSSSSSMSVMSRRQALQDCCATTATAAMFLAAAPAWAGLPEIDSQTGNLFTPKADMLKKGGSDAARGSSSSASSFSSSSSSSSSASMLFKRNPQPQQLQSIYETRFVAYLSRFLLNYEPSARAYWVQQGFGDTWEATVTESATASSPLKTNSDNKGLNSRAENAFAEFAESVEVGLADYFSGPFGSYSSLPAMVAGINAAQAAPSQQSSSSSVEPTRRPIPKFLHDLFRYAPDAVSSSPVVSRADWNKRAAAAAAMQKQGILNLYTLLKARYNSISAKRQLAILFSFVSSPSLQPVNEIRSLLGEADNATIAGVQIVLPEQRFGAEFTNFPRTSSRRGGGYSYGNTPVVTVESPPPLGDKYRQAKVDAIMEPTSRVLSILVTEGGEGYTTAPEVTVIQSNGLILRQCQATAILDREGSVDSIFVLDPGFGYGGGRRNLPPKIVIEPPKQSKEQRQRPGRGAKAYAQLEYKITGLQLIDGGNGFVVSEPPKVSIALPAEDPDWYIDVQDSPALRMIPVEATGPLRGEVTEMRFSDGNLAYSINGRLNRGTINDDLLQRMKRDPLELLPSSVRLELVRDPNTGTMIYSILQLAAVPQFVTVMSPRYRAFDPIFGGVGRLPVTKGANALTVSEYGRLALSGAVCTVVVRTVLNPLELVKTKQQLQNDDDLFRYARLRIQDKSSSQSLTSIESIVSAVNDTVMIPNSSGVMPPILSGSECEATGLSRTSTVKIGTVDLIRGIVDLRGPLALFQSADITFLASLVFGSFGFGATELFRRSFTGIFFSRTGSGSGTGAEVVLLLAASLATVLTALAASPFEVLRVRSMGLVESKKWTAVLEEFLVSYFDVNHDVSVQNYADFC